MGKELPDELQRWFAARNWTVLRAERLVGGFAALAIYQIVVLSPDLEQVPLVYKQMAPDRSSEWSLYESLSSALADYMPRLFAQIQDPAGRGLLLEDVGEPLKTTLSRSMPRTRSPLILQAVTWLTELHIRFRERSQTWLRDGVLATYPVKSSIVWAEEALERVTWAAEVGIGGVTADDIRALERQAQLFYPQLQAWMQGPSTVTHGDPHLENLLVRGQTLKLTDWEFACVAVPQRDLTIFVQDILDDDLRRAAYSHFCSVLRNAGWSVDNDAFRVSWLACFFDNTLMMLGWEVFKYRQGHLSRAELEVITATKLRWLRDAFSELSRRAL
ncbi:phosphotransferase family protein [Alicyclobacillus sp. ALC3]|uniref:phosphotransferase family protein n=1 Tax=Alicyclobacillus sp. ALC3 TaxID=2796143 RepID=UPI0023799FD3|nr:phosphotransferase [Alicyclobacillus sp. ALC3]WDL98327.1 phosphotransferase [Alicyclobacillus sp. ALC3]